MLRRDPAMSNAKELAAGLLRRADAADPGLAFRLADDVEHAIELRSDVVVQVSKDTFGSECSIAAAYLREFDPPRIVLGQSASPRRRLFSLGHEFAHHLIDQDSIVSDVLFKAGRRSATLEEAICDAFAARLLVSDKALDVALGDGGVTASSMIKLFDASNASREACAVALAQRLECEGHIVILEAEAAGDGSERFSARFCARSQNALPVARGSVQDDPLLRSSFRSGRGRGYARLRYASGSLSDEYHCDAVLAAGYVYAVLVSESPPWGGLSVRSGWGAGYETAWCEHCSHEFRPTGPKCVSCQEFLCHTCRRCACIAAAPPSARVCESCWLEKPGNRFRGSECYECAGLD